MGWDKKIMTRSRSDALSKSPKWTITDLAARWNMSTQKLSQLRREHPGFPEQEFRHESNALVSSRVYYDLHKAMAWYRLLK